MTGIIFIKKENKIEKLLRKLKYRYSKRCVAASAGLVTQPDNLKGEPSIAIRFMPWGNVNLISDIIVHETIHNILVKRLGEDVNKGFDRIYGDLDLMNYLGGF